MGGGLGAAGTDSAGWSQGNLCTNNSGGGGGRQPPDSACFEDSDQRHVCDTRQVRGLAAPQQTAVSHSTHQFLVVRRAPLGSLGPAGCRLGPARKGWRWGLPRPVHVPLPVRLLTSWAALPPRHGAETATRPWSVFRRPRQASGFLEVLSDQPCSTRNKRSEESAPRVWWLAAQAQRGSAGLCPALICPTPPDAAPADRPALHTRPRRGLRTRHQGL